MGGLLSHPQYSYNEPRHPAEYFRACYPGSCFCGQSHSRQRHVAVHRLPGGMEAYYDPMDMFPGFLGGGGGGYGMPLSGLYGMSQQMPLSMYDGLGGLYAQPGAAGGLIGGMPNLSGLGGALSNMLGQPGGGQIGTWPAEWKDPREWTTRDYDRLGEVMEECFSRQRGRGMSGGWPQSPGLSKGMPFSDLSWDSSGSRRQHRSPRPSYSDIDLLRDQMFRYAQEAKEHMQSVNDFLYGSEREQREERYKERQKKIIEEIVRGLASSSRLPEASMLGGQPVPPASLAAGGMPPGMMPGAPGMPNMMGMPPGFAMPGQSMAGMPPMYPPGFDPMAQYGGLDGFAARQGLRGGRRGARHLGGGDGIEDEFGGRRARRGRRGFDDVDDDMMDLGDEPPSPRPPRRPRPRPGRGGGGGGGGGVVFEESNRPGQEDRRGRYTAGDADRWAAYDPPAQAEQPIYETPGMSASGTRHEGQYRDAWPPSHAAPGHDIPTAAEQYTYVPPRFERQTQAARDDSQQQQRPHVSFDGGPEDARAAGQVGGRA